MVGASFIANYSKESVYCPRKLLSIVLNKYEPTHNLVNPDLAQAKRAMRRVGIARLRHRKAPKLNFKLCVATS